MEHDRPRWRFRLSTLMLLVIILALALTLVIDRWKRVQERRRLEAQAERAIADLWRAAAQGRARPQSPQPPITEP
jgi:type II secretory pathway component PulL